MSYNDIWIYIYIWYDTLCYRMHIELCIFCLTWCVVAWCVGQVKPQCVFISFHDMPATWLERPSTRRRPLLFPRQQPKKSLTSKAFGRLDLCVTWHGHFKGRQKVGLFVTKQTVRPTESHRVVPGGRLLPIFFRSSGRSKILGGQQSTSFWGTW